MLSFAFFGKSKRWTKWELDGLTARAMSGEANVLLPVWHGVEVEDVLRFSPSLADLVGANSSYQSIGAIADRVEKVLDRLAAGQSPSQAIRKDFSNDA